MQLRVAVLCGAFHSPSGTLAEIDDKNEHLILLTKHAGAPFVLTGQRAHVIWWRIGLYIAVPGQEGWLHPGLYQQ